MKVYREHTQIEVEARWLAGRRWLRRSNENSGFWRFKGIEVHHGTLPAPNSCSELPTWLCEFGSELSREYHMVRVALLEDRRIIEGQSVAEYSGRSVYIEVRQGTDVWSIARPEQDAPEELRSWASELRAYRELPVMQSDFQVEVIVFSPGAFGYLLHECLGHRLESDDFAETIAWEGDWSEIAFDVWDTPGRKHWLGYTPVDDQGTRSQPVQILCGKSGKQCQLSELTGNARAVSYDHHPIIRQRCLEVKVHKKLEPPKRCWTLLIDEVELGSFNGDVAELQTSIQRVRDEQGRIYRLPNLSLCTSPEIIRYLNPFGHLRSHHPAGGCGKMGQNQLRVTFHAPSAWCSSTSPLEIQFT